VEPDVAVTATGVLTRVPLAEATAEDLAPYTTLRRTKDLSRSQRFVAEGAKVVQRLLESPHAVESLLLTEAWVERVRPGLERRGEAVRLLVAPDRDAIERVTGFGDRAGIKALGRLAARRTLDGLLDTLPAPRLLVALDGVSNAENVGVVVRNAAALGAQALIVGERTCSPFLTRSIGASMGASFVMPSVDDMPLLDAVATLKRRGVRVVGAHPAARSRVLPATALLGDVCFVFGAEGDGISADVLAACDLTVSIPMPAAVDSLNVASAAAVFLYEAWRQRRGPGGVNGPCAP
jgi:tRNA G18 (ribose-2'-O)-methylase SpoU